MKTFSQWFKEDFRNRILAGVLVTLPLAATLLVLRVLFRWVDNFASPWVREILKIDFPGLGVLLTVAAVYLAGVFAANVIGRRVIGWLEVSILGKVPLVRTLYPSLKKVVGMFSLPPSESFKRVVLLEFPRAGVRSMGFVTGETQDPQTGRTLVNVFIPTVPNPTSGILQLVPEEALETTPLSIEEGMRIVVSGGFLDGERLRP